MIAAPHILLLSGNSQNVGKTTFACSVISKFSKENHSIVGVKISSHFHTLPLNAHIIMQNQNVVVIKENLSNTNKDSSLFLQSGAVEVLYIQAIHDGLQLIVLDLLQYIDNRMCVCESGGLMDFVEPGVYLYFNNTQSQIKNDTYTKADRIITNFDSSGIQLQIQQNSWKLV